MAKARKATQAQTQTTIATVEPDIVSGSTTPDGTTVDVARSAAQQAVRSGDEQAGIYWIRQLYDAGRDV